MRNAEDLKQEFESIWDSFSSDLDAFYEDAARRAVRNDNLSLHGVFREVRMVPKRGLQEVLRRDEDEEVNVGSATGLFFEQMAASLIETALNEVVPSIIIERNQTDHPKLRAVFEQPDLVARIPGKDSFAVFEFKTAPKKNTLEKVQDQRREYQHSQASVRFYLIGGHVRTTQEKLRKFVSQARSTFLTASSKNMSVIKAGPTLDDLVEDAAQFLTS